MEAIRGATSTSICVCERWPGIDTQIFLYEFMVDCVRIHIYGLILQISGFSTDDDDPSPRAFLSIQ